MEATDGNLYGTTADGGANGEGTVFSLSVGLGPFVETEPTAAKVGATVNILGTNLTGATSVSFNGNMARGAIPYSALVKEVNGIFYGATLLGGTFGYGSLYSVTTTGAVATVYSFTGGADGGPPISLSPGPGGSLLGTTSGTTISTSDPGTVFQFVP
jgi:uncharacterized repeat protein (TIGR03803 family)